jgi:hypothetical protein
MEPEMALSPQVTTALISGGAALVVALLGIAGAIVAQLVATRRAFANSLALFEREHDKQERERAAEARREDEYRFADQRRSTYARMLRAAADLYLALLALNAAAEGWRFVRDPGTGNELPEVRAKDEARWMGLLRDAHARWERMRAELEEVAEEVELLASGDVRHAAGELGDIVSKPPDLGEAAVALEYPHIPVGRHSVAQRMRRFSSYDGARTAFLDAARRELGIGAGSAAAGPPQRSS